MAWGRNWKADDLDGRNPTEIAAERRRVFQREKCMSSEVNGDLELLATAREYISAYELARERGARLAKLIGDRKETLVVSFDGRRFEIENDVLKGGMPVIVRPAVVIGE